MDDNNNNNPNRNYNGGMNRNNRNRFRGGGGGGRHGGDRHGPRGRTQRPLLTSSTNGAGLAFVSLSLLIGQAQAGDSRKLLMYAVISFGISAVVSYIAQRLKPVIFEKLSDIFFLVGTVLVVVSAILLGKSYGLI